MDLSYGSLLFYAPQNGRVEVHVADATFRPETNVLSQATVEMLGPKVLQVHPIHGNLEFPTVTNFNCFLRAKHTGSIWTRPQRRRNRWARVPID